MEEMALIFLVRSGQVQWVQINQVQNRGWKPKSSTQQNFSQLSSRANTEGSTLSADSILPYSTDRRCQSPVKTVVSHCTAVFPASMNHHLQHDHGVQTNIQICYVLLSLFCCLSWLSLKPALLVHYWPGRWAVCLGKSFSSNIYTEWKCKAHIIDGGWCCKVWI